MTTDRPLHHFVRASALAACALVAVGCGDVARTGRSPGFLVIDSVEGASGADPGAFGNPVHSDVETLVEQTIGGQLVRVPTIFNDLGRIRVRGQLKNPGTSILPAVATPLNAITLSRYRVVFKRSDGRNTQGVDVPWAFDGGITLTVPADGGTAVTGAFELVRHTAKLEQPLRNLRGLGGALFINTLAEITFYGKDQAGNDVSVTATLSVDFGDFADPA